MKSILVSFIVFVIVVTWTVASLKSGLSLEERLNRHPARDLSVWRENMRAPLFDRLGPAPALIEEFVALDNEKQGWAERPRAFNPDESLRRDLREALRTIPDQVRRVLERKLVGIFLVSDLGGSAYTNWVRNEDGERVAGLIVLDATMLDRKGNEWATYKESTPFRDDGQGYELSAMISDPESDSRVEALRYIILHEAGHVLNVGSSDVLTFDGYDKEDIANYPFTKITWAIRREENRLSFSTPFDEKFLERSRIVYYSSNEKRRPMSEAVRIYSSLEQTDFPTLYAVTNPFDDFAECFVSYVHTQLMKRPWKITIRRNGNIVKEYVPCWGEKRCAVKLQALKKILDSEGS